METWCWVSNSASWGDSSHASSQTAQRERFSSRQRHRSCGCFLPFIRNISISIRSVSVTCHGCRAQEPAEVSAAAEIQVAGIPHVIAYSFSEKHASEAADAMHRSGCSHLACQDRNASAAGTHHPFEVVTPALPSFCLHPVFTVTDRGQQKSKGDSVLVTHVKADYFIPKPWDWRSGSAHPRATGDAAILKHEGDRVLLCQLEGQLFHAIRAVCLPCQGVLKKPVKEYIMRLQAAKPVWVNARIPCRVSFWLCIRGALSGERGIPLFRQRTFNDENPWRSRGDPPSQLVAILSSPGFLTFWRYVRNVSTGSVLPEPGKHDKNPPSRLAHTIWKRPEQPSCLRKLKPGCPCLPKNKSTSLPYKKLRGTTQGF